MTAAPSAAEVTPSAAAKPVVHLGTGQFVKPDDGRRYRVTTTDAGDITLNFEEAELRQVVMVILGELLDETYYMDPSIKGTVTVHNDNSLRRDQLLPILEELLQMNGAALVQAPGGYKIVPLGEAERQALPPSAARWPPSASRGYTVQIIPLEFASADEVASVLAPYVPEGGSPHPRRAGAQHRRVPADRAGLRRRLARGHEHGHVSAHLCRRLHGGRRARAAPGHCRWLAHGRYGAPVPHRTPQLAAGGHFPATLSAGHALVDRRSGPRR
jgi:hypothetical protein